MVHVDFRGVYQILKSGKSEILNFILFTLIPYKWSFHSYSLFFDAQQEVSAAADEAARLYLERTKADERSSRGIHNAMHEAAQSKVKSFRTEFDKLSSVATPKNGPRFLEEVGPFFFRGQFIKVMKLYSYWMMCAG